MSTEWSAEEVAAVVAFLASPDANYLVGEVVRRISGKSLGTFFADVEL